MCVLGMSAHVRQCILKWNVSGTLFQAFYVSVIHNTATPKDFGDFKIYAENKEIFTELETCGLVARNPTIRRGHNSQILQFGEHNCSLAFKVKQSIPLTEHLDPRPLHLEEVAKHIPVMNASLCISNSVVATSPGIQLSAFRKIFHCILP